MKIHRLSSYILTLQIVACNRPSADGESDSEGLTAEGQEEGTVTDLPCGGADLQTDDLNCGACGNECYSMWPETEYAAGECVNGSCSPRWTGWFGHLPPPDIRTCEQICAYGNIPCVPRGCSGMTALVCGEYTEWSNRCDLGDPAHHAMIEFSGECDEPVPYPKDTDDYYLIDFACCCDF